MFHLLIFSYDLHTTYVILYFLHLKLEVLFSALKFFLQITMKTIQDFLLYPMAKFNAQFVKNV